MSTVGNQAVTQGTTTGRESGPVAEKLLAKRKVKDRSPDESPIWQTVIDELLASPPKREKRRKEMKWSPTYLTGSEQGTRSTTATNIKTVDLTWDDETRESTPTPKKARNAGPKPKKERGDVAMFSRFRDILNQVQKTAKRLSNATTQEGAARKDFQGISEELSSLASQLATEEVQRMLDDLQPGEGGTKITYVVQSAPVADKPATVSMSTQTESNTVGVACQTNAWHKKDPALQVMESLGKKERSEEEFVQIAKLQWPANAFTATTLIEGEILPSETTVAFWDKDPRGLYPVIVTRYPDIEEVEGPVGLLSVTSKMTNKAGVVEARERKFYKLQGESSYSTLSSLKDRLLQEEDAAIAIKSPSEDERRMWEYIFRNTKIAVRIYNHLITKDRKTREEGVVIRSENTSYADLLKKVKTAVGKDNDGIKQVRKTKDGAVLLVLEKNQRRTEELTIKLRDIQGATTKRTDHNRVLFNVLDLDEITSKEEVAEAIKSKLGATSKEFEVKNIRPTKSGRLTATVAMDETLANIARERTRIKVGLAPCRIQERKEVKRCFRCWGYGHESYKCEGPDRRNLCLKCGQEGHIAAACTNVECCPLCDNQRHQAGSGTCQAFRKALKEKGTPSVVQKTRATPRRKRSPKTPVTKAAQKTPKSTTTTKPTTASKSKTTPKPTTASKPPTTISAESPKPSTSSNGD